MFTIYIDADACSVKEETYKVAARHRLKVIVVANNYLNVPLEPDIEMKVVAGHFDAADDWIAESITANDILITSDLLLAARALQKKARVVGAKGHELTEENIGSVLGSRELNAHLRNLGHANTGPKPMTKSDRSQFLSTLEQMIQKLLRSAKV